MEKTIEVFSIYALWVALVLYGVAFFFYLYFFISKRSMVGILATYVALIGWIMHTISLGARWISSSHIPALTAYESFSFVSWFIVLGYLLIEYRAKIKVLGIFLMPVACLFLIQGLREYTAPAPAIPIFQSGLVEIHSTIIFIASAAFLVAAGAAILYLIQERQVKKKKVSMLFKRLPSLETLDLIGYRAIIFGYPFLTLVIITGAIRAYQVKWQTIWDAILIVSASVWVIYTLYLILRVWAGWRGRKAAILAILGFLGLLFIRFVVVPYLSLQHGYRA